MKKLFILAVGLLTVIPMNMAWAVGSHQPVHNDTIETLIVAGSSQLRTTLLNEAKQDRDNQVKTVEVQAELMKKVNLLGDLTKRPAPKLFMQVEPIPHPSELSLPGVVVEDVMIALSDS